MSNILYGMIHSKAENTYLGPKPTAANYELWVAHWFESAERLAIDFDTEDLTATAKTIRDIIENNRRMLKR